MRAGGSFPKVEYARAHGGARTNTTIAKCIGAQPWGQAISAYVAWDIVRVLYPGPYTSVDYLLPSTPLFFPFRCTVCSNVYTSEIQDMSKQFTRPGPQTHGCGFCCGKGNANPHPVNDSKGRPHSDGRNSAETMLDIDDKRCFALSNAPLKLSMFSHQSSHHNLQWTCPFHPTFDGLPYEYELCIKSVFLSAEPCPQCKSRRV